MKRFAYLWAALGLALAAAPAAALSPRHVAASVARMAAAADPGPNASAMSFMGFLMDPFSLTVVQEKPDDEPAPPATPQARCSHGDDWQSDLVAETLKTWQVLCKKGRLGEAEQLANMLVSLQPDNPQVRAACTVTQLFKSLAVRMTPDLATPEGVWQMPVPAPLACDNAGCVAGRCQLPGTMQARAECCTKAVNGCCAERGCCSAQTTATRNCTCCKNNDCCCARSGPPACCDIVMPHPMPGMHIAPHPGMVMPHVIVVSNPDAPLVGLSADRLVAHDVHLTYPRGPRGVQQARLKTAHLEAHCESLTCAGSPNRVVLEGGVQLTYRKDGQHIQLTAHRVVVNVKEETFTVESHPATPRHTLPAMEVHRSMHVVPVPPTPED